MIELEKTYLLKYLPKDYKKFPKKEIIDVYFPKGEKLWESFARPLAFCSQKAKGVQLL